MEEAGFKDSFHATLADAVKIQRRFQRRLAGENYMVGICGSTVTKGEGKDIDVVIVAAPTANTSVSEIADLLMQSVKRLYYYEEVEYSDDFSHVYMNFVSHDDLFIDVYINGLT